MVVKTLSVDPEVGAYIMSCDMYICSASGEMSRHVSCGLAIAVYKPGQMGDPRVSTLIEGTEGFCTLLTMGLCCSCGPS